MHVIQSPYELNRAILLDDTYYMSRRLQDFVLHQYSCGFPFDASEHLANFDSHHLQIYNDLKQFFRDNGPTMEHWDIALTVISRRTAEAQAVFDMLIVLCATDPADYPAEDGLSPAEAHRSAVERCELLRRYHTKMGFEITSPSPGIQI